MQEGVSSQGQSYGYGVRPRRTQSPAPNHTASEGGWRKALCSPSDFYPTEHCMSASLWDHAAPSYPTACAAVRYPNLCALAKHSLSMRAPSSLFWGAHVHTSGVGWTTKHLGRACLKNSSLGCTYRVALSAQGGIWGSLN